MVKSGVVKEKERYEVIINTKREYKNLKENIRILETDNHFKLIVAREISNYMSAVSRPWDSLYRADVNAETLAKHLNSRFPEFKGGWEFRTTQSQGVFDVVFLGGRLIIQVKSVKGNKTKLLANASLYPDKVTARHALDTNFKYPKQSGLFQSVENLSNTPLDVLVVCVTQLEDIVTGYAIVDGNYWGIDEEMFLACKDYFTDINENLDEINAVLADENIFARAMLEGTLGDAVDLKLRKLIKITNPVGRLDVLGRWGISRG